MSVSDKVVKEFDSWFSCCYSFNYKKLLLCKRKGGSNPTFEGLFAPLSNSEVQAMCCMFIDILCWRKIVVKFLVCFLIEKKDFLYNLHNSLSCYIIGFIYFTEELWKTILFWFWFFILLWMSMCKWSINDQVF